jgi:hypothetical protein
MLRRLYAALLITLLMAASGTSAALADACSDYEAAETRAQSAERVSNAARKRMVAAEAALEKARADYEKAKADRSAYQDRRAKVFDVARKSEEGSDEWRGAKIKYEEMGWDHFRYEIPVEDTGKVLDAALDAEDATKAAAAKLKAEADKARAEANALKPACDAQKKKEADEKAAALKAAADAEAARKAAEAADVGFVTTDCAPCARLASLLNDLVGSIQTTEADLEKERAKLAKLDAKAKLLNAEAKRANDTWLADLQFLTKLEKAGGNVEGLREEYREKSRDAGWKTFHAENATFAADRQREVVDGMAKRLESLKANEKTTRKKLRDCEKQCKGEAKEPPKISTGQDPGTTTIPGGDPAPKPVATDCPPCAAEASLLADIRGTIASLTDQLQNAKADLAAKVAASDRAARDLKDAQNRFGDAIVTRDKFPAGSDGYKAQNALYREWLDKASDLLDPFDDAFLAANDAREKVSELEKQLADWQAREAPQEARLKACEQQCTAAPAGPAIAVGVPGVPVQPEGTTTDCPPCAALASLVADIRGSITTTESELAKARADLAARDAATETLRADMKAAQDAFSAALFERDALIKAGKDGSAKHAEFERELNRASDILSEIEDKDLEALDARDKVAALEAQLANWQAQLEPALAKLRECEKQCGGGDPPKVAIGTDPVPATGGADCDDCVKAKGDLAVTQVRIGEVQDKIAVLQAELAGLKAAEADLASRVKTCGDTCPETALVVPGDSATAVPGDASSVIETGGEACEAGATCRITYNGDGVAIDWMEYPVFLTTNIAVETEADSGMFCASTGRGSICAQTGDGTAPAVPSQRAIPVNLALGIDMPSTASRTTSFCVGSAAFGADSPAKSVLQAVQLGLLMMGIDVGTPDGLMGRNTRAGIAALAADRGDLDPQDINAVFAALFGTPLPEASVSGGENCADLEVTGGRSAAPAPKKKKTLFGLEFGKPPPPSANTGRD